MNTTELAQKIIQAIHDKIEPSLLFIEIDEKTFIVRTKHDVETNNGNFVVFAMDDGWDTQEDGKTQYFKISIKAIDNPNGE